MFGMQMLPSSGMLFIDAPLTVDAGYATRRESPGVGGAYQAHRGRLIAVARRLIA
jgi:hypothetical protein